MSNNTKELNEKRRLAIEEAIPVLENLINNVELFCPHDMIIIQQGSIQVFSGELGVKLNLLE